MYTRHYNNNNAYYDTQQHCTPGPPSHGRIFTPCYNQTFRFGPLCGFPFGPLCGLPLCGFPFGPLCGLPLCGFPLCGLPFGFRLNGLIFFLQNVIQKLISSRRYTFAVIFGK